MDFVELESVGNRAGAAAAAAGAIAGTAIFDVWTLAVCLATLAVLALIILGGDPRDFVTTTAH